MGETASSRTRARSSPPARTALLAALLAGSAFVLAFGIGELVVRLLPESMQAASGGEARLLFFSAPAFVGAPGQAVHYAPDASIETAAVHGGRVEYRVRFRTNDLGFVDELDYAAGEGGGTEAGGERRIALVGDSFTAGYHGGAPWVPRLRGWKAAAGVRIYNLGVSGTGTLHFPRVLALLGEEAKLTDIVFVIISDDLARPLWYPLTRAGTIRFCIEDRPPEACLDEPPVAYLHEASASDEALLARARALESARQRGRGPLGRLLRRSRLATLAVRVGRSLVDRGRQRQSLAFVDAVRRRFPQASLQVVHLPQKHEVAAGRYDASGLASRLASRGVRYFPALHRCEWKAEYFHPRDPHPNARGYAAIERCVGNLLLLGSPSQAAAPGMK